MSAADDLRMMMAACYMDPRNKAAVKAAIAEIEQKTYALEVIRREAKFWLDGNSASSAQTIIRRAHMRADGALRETNGGTDNG